jgi:2-oxoacid dehydrogenases acyltransferase (catalytic domain)
LQVRRIIAKRLLESKQTTPALYISAEVSLDALDELRRSLAAQGTKVSVCTAAHSSTSCTAVCALVLLGCVIGHMRCHPSVYLSISALLADVEPYWALLNPDPMHCHVCHRRYL